jgi:beta-galactosidase
VDGLVYPDRRVHTGLLEAKEIYAPIRARLIDALTGEIEIESLREFKSLEDISLVWSFEQNGESAFNGAVRSLDIAPRTTKRIKLDYDVDKSKFNYLNLSFRYNTKTAFSDTGYELASEQFEISLPEKKSLCAEKLPIEFIESDRYINIATGETTFRIDKKNGLVDSITDNGTEFLAKPITPNIWRAPIDNDRNVKNKWMSLGFDHIDVKCYECKISNESDTSLTVFAKLSLGANARAPMMYLDTSYTFNSNGTLDISVDASVKCDTFLPRFGFEIIMSEGFENLTYFGHGPHESYCDKRMSTHISRFKTTVSDNFEHYVRPQDNSNHYGTRWANIANIAAQSLVFASHDGFEFNAQHYTAKMLTETAHDFELKPLKETVVNIDYRHAGIGSNSCGPELDNKFKLSDANMVFKFRLIPSNINYIDPFVEIKKK